MNDSEKAIYNKLKDEIKKIAADGGLTEIGIDLALSWTSEELGESESGASAEYIYG